MMTYQTIIKIRKTTPPAKLQELTAIINGLFDNRAGKVKNSSNNPYTLIFAGDERDFPCLDLGALSLEDVPGLLGYISACWWIDKEYPAESCNVLKIFATPVRTRRRKEQ